MGTNNSQFPKQFGFGWFVIFLAIAAIFFIVDLIIKLKQ